MVTVTFRNAEIKTPTATVRGRFFFRDGKAALWTEDKRARTASRVLYADGSTFSRSGSARIPHTLSVADEQWSVRQLHGSGCGCNSVMKRLSVDQALDPAIDHLA